MLKLKTFSYLCETVSRLLRRCCPFPAVTEHSASSAAGVSVPRASQEKTNHAGCCARAVPVPPARLRYQIAARGDERGGKGQMKSMDVRKQRWSDRNTARNCWKCTISKRLDLLKPTWPHKRSLCVELAPWLCWSQTRDFNRNVEVKAAFLGVSNFFLPLNFDFLY